MRAGAALVFLLARRPAHFGLGLLLLGSCADARASLNLGEPKRPKPRAPAQLLFLNEPWQLSNATCRVTSARSALVESSALPYPKARVRPDVRALEVVLHCETPRGEAVDSRKVLPDDSVVLLELAHGKALAPRPVEAPAPPHEQNADSARDRLVFDLPDDAEPELPTARRFAADTGQSVVPREHAIAKLSLRATTVSVEVTLRQRYQDGMVDGLVDQLALALANGTSLAALARDAEAEAALVQLAAIYADVRHRFQPARLELSQLSAHAAETRAITLSLTRPRNRESAFEVARFELTLAQTPKGALRIQSFDNREAARNALACDTLQDELRHSLVSLSAKAAHSAHQGDKRANSQTCNALGLLLPAACNEVEPGLLARALEVGARCGEPFKTAKSDRHNLPGDFQITLRRGRAQSGLDRQPRYVVSLFHGGQVVFHGKSWVESQERSDGRTDLGLLAGLYEHIRALDFFARRGGEYDPEHCSPSDDQGDVMTVIAADKQRMVLNRNGCRGPFSEGELTEIRRQVERISGLSAWTQRGIALADQEAEQWAIAE
jgi:hypothetical protein